MGRKIEWELYTDGACRPNPGFGGWGFILRKRERTLADDPISIGGYEESTTNNRMELQAVIEGLKRFSTVEGNNKSLRLVSDSKYLVHGVEEWCHQWANNGWVKKDGKPILNIDLWQEIYELIQKITIRCIHVKGHSGHRMNERADEIAVQSLKKGQKDKKREADA